MPATDLFKTSLGRLFDAGKTAKFLRLLVTLALLLLVARTAADLSWQLATPLLNQGRSAAGAKIPSQITSPMPQPARNLPAPPEEISLFGQAAGLVSTPGVSGSDVAPATTLNLILKGVVAVHPMRRALAVIAERGGASEKLYGQGEELPGSAVIREIHPDKVIISRAGVLETLFLDNLLNQTSSRPAPPAANRTTSAGSNIRPQGDGTTWQIDQGYWQERLADVPGLAREVGVEIYKENDQQKGYRLVAVQNSKLLNDLGLQAGDILLSVNGLAMSSVQEGLTAYQQIKNGGHITIEINHGGRRETKSYNING